MSWNGGAMIRIVGLVSCVLITVMGLGCASTWSQEVQYTRVKHYGPDDAPGERIAYLPLGNSCKFRRATANDHLPVLVFVHGLGASKYFWKDVAYAMLYQYEYRAVLVDLLGHGDADKPSGADYSPSAQGHRLAEFVRNNHCLLGDDIVFVSTSYGAVSSLEAVLELQKTPEVGVPTVRGIFSVSAPAFYFPALEEAPHAMKTLRDPPLIARLASPLLHTRFFERQILERSMWRSDQIREADREEIRTRYGYFERSARKALLRSTVDLVQELKARKWECHHFDDIRCPTRIVGGYEDEIVPVRVQQKLSESIVGSKVELFENCGHAVAQDQPTQLVNSLVEFLKEVVSKRPPTIGPTT